MTQMSIEGTEGTIPAEIREKGEEVLELRDAVERAGQKHTEGKDELLAMMLESECPAFSIDGVDFDVRDTGKKLRYLGYHVPKDEPAE